MGDKSVRSWEVSRARGRLGGYAQPAADGSVWASNRMPRDMWPAPHRRRRCTCGCRGPLTHYGGVGGVVLMSGCELRVRRWVREGVS